jgi:hypothetical protein
MRTFLNTKLLVTGFEREMPIFYQFLFFLLKFLDFKRVLWLFCVFYLKIMRNVDGDLF